MGVIQMANLNKVMLIGRLTRDPEVRMFANGGKVAKFGFAVNNRRKNQQTGQFEDEPVFIDVEAFNRGDFGKLADNVEQFLHKGNQVFLEGHLKLDQWTTQDGQKRSQLRIVLDNMQFLEPRQDGGGGGGGGQRSYPSKNRPEQGPPSHDFDAGPESHGAPDNHMDAPPPRAGEEDIPF